MPAYRDLMTGPDDDAEGTDAAVARGYGHRPAARTSRPPGRPSRRGDGPRGGPGRGRARRSGWTRWPRPVRRSPGPGPAAGRGAPGRSGRGPRPTGGRGGGGGGGMGSMRAGIRASPALLATLDALPPAQDQPGVDVAGPAPRRPGSGASGLRPFVVGFIIGLVLDPSTRCPAWPGPFWSAAASTRRGGPCHRRRLLTAGLALPWFSPTGSSREPDRGGRAHRRRILYSLRVKIFSHLQLLGLDFYDTSWPAGS